MPSSSPHPDKRAALRAHHAANPRPETVTDPAFTAGDPFFDPRDIVKQARQDQHKGLASVWVLIGLTKNPLAE